MKSFKVVLVEPKYPMNVGSIARTMYCTGFEELIVVNPLCDIFSSDARKFSLFAKEEVLFNAKIKNSLEELKGEDNLLFSFTRRLGKKHRANPIFLSELPTFIKDKNKNIHLVFGGESSGLSNSDIEISDYIVSIDTNVVKQSLSLPASVAMILHEIRRNFLLFDSIPATEANVKAKEVLLSKIMNGLQKINFIDENDSKNMHVVFEKMINKLDERELNILFSVLGDLKL